MINCMVLELLSVQMEISMRVNGLMIKFKEKGHL